MCDFIWILSCGCNVVVHICDFLYTTSGKYLIDSTLILSIPGHLLIFVVHTASLIPDDVNGVNIDIGNTFCIGVTFA